MKIENFTAVANLIKEREYVATLCGFVGLETSRLAIMTNSNSRLDVRPDLVAKIAPEMKLVFTQQIAVIDEKLATLGVTAS